MIKLNNKVTVLNTIYVYYKMISRRWYNTGIYYEIDNYVSCVGVVVGTVMTVGVVILPKHRFSDRILTIISSSILRKSSPTSAGYGTGSGSSRHCNQN